MLNRRFLFVATAIAALAGCATRSSPVSIADTIAARPQLSTFNGMLTKTGLADTLKGTELFTVFAPTNEAFAKVSTKTMDALAKDPVQLKAVLSYHIIPGKLMAADVKNGNNKTSNGASVALGKAGDFVTVEEAMVQTADISASNGVIHIVDSVLIPPVHK